MAVKDPTPSTSTTMTTKSRTKTKKELDAKRLLKARRLKANQKLRLKQSKSNETPRSPSPTTSTTSDQYPTSVPSASNTQSASKSHLQPDQLPWRSLDESSSNQGISLLDEGGGMMMFEEVEGVDVEWEEGEGGRRKAVLVQKEKVEGGTEGKGKGKEKKEKAKEKAKEKEKGKKRKRDGEVGIDIKEEELEVEDVDLAEGVEEFEIDQPLDNARSSSPSSSTHEEPLDDVHPSSSSSSSALQDIPVYDYPFPDTKLPSWAPESFNPSLPVPLHPIILRGLKSKSFENPTEVQKRSIGLGMGGKSSESIGVDNEDMIEGTEKDGEREEEEDVKPSSQTDPTTPTPAFTKRDLITISETGSGKTLAYSIPILHHLLSKQLIPNPKKRRQLSALILCPTRELALQVGRHLSELVEAGEGAAEEESIKKGRKGKGKGKSKGKGKNEEEEGEDQKPGLEDGEEKVKAKVNKETKPPRISIATVVGGLSALKQKRLLKRGCDILIATPGRLWELCEEDESLAIQIKRISFLVIDEADRMIETGHFAELENILLLTSRSSSHAALPASNTSIDDPIFAKVTREIHTTHPREDMQTFVFSATLSKDLQANLKRGVQRGRMRRSGGENGGSTMDDLMERLDFRDEKPVVINLSREGGVVATLRESLVECIISEKDFYLYYFLLRYPGRTLVFVGSVDGIRRIVPLFEILKVPVFPLHSQLQQKQRLKNLDRFASSKSGVLIATDVAARGLDIPSVDHVIHFQLPRTADAYIHRSGRTARAKKDGFSLIMCSPDERPALRALMKGLGRTPDLPELPIEPGFLTPMKNRIRIAREIEKAQHHTKREKSEKSWMREAAETLGVDLEDDMISGGDSEDEPEAKRRKNATHKFSQGNVANLKAELDSLLRQQLMARGVSAKYPTSGSRAIMEDLLSADSHHIEMLGASTKKAHEDVDAKPKPKKFLTFGNKRKVKQ